MRLTGGFVLDIAHDGFRMLRVVGHHRAKGKICPLVYSISGNLREIYFFFFLFKVAKTNFILYKSGKQWQGQDIMKHLCSLTECL